MLSPGEPNLTAVKFMFVGVRHWNVQSTVTGPVPVDTLTTVLTSHISLRNICL